MSASTVAGVCAIAFSSLPSCSSGRPVMPSGTSTSLAMWIRSSDLALAPSLPVADAPLGPASDSRPVTIGSAVTPLDRWLGHRAHRRGGADAHLVLLHDRTVVAAGSGLGDDQHTLAGHVPAGCPAHGRPRLARPARCPVCCFRWHRRRARHRAEGLPGFRCCRCRLRPGAAAPRWPVC